MTTARTIIKRAMQDNGVLTKGENPSADEANDALDALNALIDSWSNFSANIYSRALETFSLTSAASYLIGAGQTWNTTRPVQIVDAYTTIGTIDYPLSIINQEQYDSISFKANAGIPQYLVYNNAYPYGTVTLYPTPAGPTSITLLSEKPITTFATLDTSASLPQGWERALVKNLAMELTPQYGQRVTPELAQAAKESLGAIKLSVIRARPVNSSPSVRTTNNVYTGWYS